MTKKPTTPSEPIRVRDVCAAIDQWAPPTLAYDWDKPGLGIGDPDWEVSRLSVTLTITPETLRLAMAKGADMIVSHHPVIWEPLKHLRADTPHARLCLDLVRAEVACFAAHTNLDVAPGGVNDVLAERLGLLDCKPLFPRFRDQTTAGPSVKLVTFVPESDLAPVRRAVCEAGGGHIGNYACCSYSSAGVGTFLPEDGANPFVGKRGIMNQEPERRLEIVVPKKALGAALAALKAAHPYEEPAFDVYPLLEPLPAAALGVCGRLPKALRLDAFAAEVCGNLGLQYARVLGDGRKSVSSVAVLGGSGGSKVGELPDDCDVYVTGDIGYHDAEQLLGRGIAAIDGGHSGTERCIVPVLAEYLRRKFPALHVFEHEDPEPFHAVQVKKG